ncbi:DUF3768 domain-containing protein [Cognatishimia sp. MH4019]|uniref:DUF3768 domain-containing protein n=1 Tax=Cognatishimia sp. MH4019 TaxID=2854030 RepID=UPI001CD52A82|nr:DUF3768 domain-containing protein [Cognatishimia sp. MH4019]
MSEQIPTDENALIAQQNDLFRNSCGQDPTVRGRIMVTRGVDDLAPVVQAIIVQRVQTFSEFTEDNDPYGDHTFGAFDLTVTGPTYKLSWKIDLYDTDYRMGSPNPADLNVTRRVLTIMLAHEY